MDDPRNAPSLWQRRPAPDDMPLKFRLVRVKPKGLQPSVITSHDLIGCYTHFHRGRSQPCFPTDCPACADGASRRWYGYLMIFSPRSAEQAILEITSAAAGPVDMWFRQNRTLRGALISGHRVPERPNGRLFLTLSKWAGEKETLPSTPNVKNILLNMWGVTQEQLQPTNFTPTLKMVTSDNGSEQNTSRKSTHGN